MPIYEYRCSSCGHELEVLQKFSEAPLAVCPACSASALKKLVSAAGFQLKGTGWYATDFKSSGRQPAAKPVDGATASGESTTKSDTKSESKPESTTAKPESKSESKSDTKKTPATAASSGSGSADS